MKRAIFALVVIAAFSALGWQVYVRIGEQKGDNDRRGRGGNKTIAVETTPIHNATVRQVGQFSGSLSPVSSFVVSPKIGGRLERVTVDVGDKVKSGDLIAELDDDEYRQGVGQARAELAVAKAGVAEARSALEIGKRELDRMKSLHSKNIASDAELDEAKARFAASNAKYEVAKAEVTRREAALKSAEIRLSYAKIHVTWEGDGERVIGERFVDQGEQLKANSPIVTVLDNSVLTAEVDVIERDYPKIVVGQKAAITTDAYPDLEFAGAVARIAPLLQANSRQARVEIEAPNPENLLKPGMFVRASVEFARHEDVTVVPVASLARREGKQGVFLVDKTEMKAIFKPLILGIREGEIVEVVEPELEGEVITLGHHLLSDGGKIRLYEAGKPGKGKRKGSK